MPGVGVVPAYDLQENHRNFRNKAGQRSQTTRLAAEELNALVGRLLTGEYSANPRDLYVSSRLVIDNAGNWVGGDWSGGTIQWSAIADNIPAGKILELADTAAIVDADTLGSALYIDGTGDVFFNTVDSGGSITSQGAIQGNTSAVPGVSHSFAGTTNLNPAAATEVPLKVSGFLGQTADLARWCDNAGTVLANISAAGVGSFPRLVATATDDAGAALLLPQQTAPAALADGMIWRDATSVWVRFGGSSVDILAGGAVASVFGRTGAVVAQANDYTFAQIDKSTSSLADLNTRSAADLSSGTLSDARLSANVPLKASSNTFTSGQVIDLAANAVGLTVEGAAGQTANLALYRNAAGGQLLAIDSAGILRGDGAGSAFLELSLAAGARVGYGASYGYAAGSGWDVFASSSNFFSIRANVGGTGRFGSSVRSDGVYGFSSSTTAPGTVDTAIQRAAAGVLLASNGSGTAATVRALAYQDSAGAQVVGTRGAAVADATGGATIDAEARTAINTLLARLRTHGLIAT